MPCWPANEAGSTETGSTAPSPRPYSSPSLPSVAQPNCLTILRTQWKWAAFSQFFFTFSRLFLLNGVSLSDVEDDLVKGTRSVLPRIMQRLLFILSYDRKISLFNWQSALRKQYRKRNPLANPIGPEPPVVEQKNGYGNSLTPVHADGDEEDNVLDLNEMKDDNEKVNLEADEKGASVQPSEIESESIHIRPAQRVGGIEVSKDWLDLPMLAKLDSMYLLTEWQFQNPTRLRTLMKSDDENASWRIEPIGYDAKRCAYWLIGADRLWIQRPSPKSRPKTNDTSSSLKRKRAKLPSFKIEQPNIKSLPLKRPRLENCLDIGIPRGRVAKSRARFKLEQHAAALVEYQRQEKLNRSFEKNGKFSVSRVEVVKTTGNSPVRNRRAARANARSRLRGTDGDIWEAIPEEWLTEEQSKEGKRTGERDEAEQEESNKERNVDGSVLPLSRTLVTDKQTGLESRSDMSELTELTEECASAEGMCQGNTENQDITGANNVVFKNERMSSPVTSENCRESLGDFVEWEMICSTLSEWSCIAERFEKATHYAERALYKILSNDIVPPVTQELRESERKKALTIAMGQRKRSSRLLMRQSEKEEVETMARKLAEEAERSSRARRQEARARRDEEARAKREMARIMRGRKREEKEEWSKIEREAAIRNADDLHRGFSNNLIIGKVISCDCQSCNKSVEKTRNGRCRNKRCSQEPTGEDWELDCEVCQRRGINFDDGIPIMSCGSCLKWQHIPCHDVADEKAGRERRNWDVVEFICRRCRRKRNASWSISSNGDDSHQLSTSQPHPDVPHSSF